MSVRVKSNEIPEPVPMDSEGFLSLPMPDEIEALATRLESAAEISASLVQELIDKFAHFLIYLDDNWAVPDFDDVAAPFSRAIEAIGKHGKPEQHQLLRDGLLEIVRGQRGRMCREGVNCALSQFRYRPFLCITSV
jgi:hypothetical protein